ncbi:hypothetical protein PT974_02828 [Cladobotryum mycophilum]|uniref:Histone deacetylase complex subunit SAP18 n=1 Tax=Cladobotryum mycophilum TaxID=491253 RepID=A0ABR0SZ72_9HYPO
MSTLSDKNDRDLTAPFLVKLFHRNGAFHRPEEFASPSLPPHILVYTWSSCTLKELALELAASKPSVLQIPTIGTRLAFQLVCPDLRGTSATSTSHPRFAVKDLGSIVIGEGGPGIDDSDDGSFDGPLRDEDASHKTLSDARFVHQHRTQGEAQYPGERVAAIFGEGFLGGKTALVEVMVAQVGEVVETPPPVVAVFLWVNGGEERGYQRGHREDHAVEGAGNCRGIRRTYFKIV